MELNFKDIMEMHNGSDFNKELREKLKKENRRLKVLWITDDYERGMTQNTFKQNAKDWFVDLYFTNVFKYKDGYDVVMIDYGMLGGNKKADKEEMRNIKVLQDYNATEIKMVWCGGLSGRYEEAVRIDFPKNKFLHTIRSLYLNNFCVSLRRWLGGIDRW